MAFSGNLGRKIYMKRTYLKPDVKTIDFRLDENIAYVVDMSGVEEFNIDLENAGGEIAG